jgi:hypothetical protein
MKSLDVSVSSFALLIASLLVFIGLASVRFGWHKIRVNRNNS